MIASRVTTNLQRSLQRFFDLESKMSSGRRINKPSDDPAGTVRALNYRTEIAKIAQYRKNVSQAMSWMTNYDSTLADLKNFVSTSKEIAVAMSNGTFDSVARQASAEEVRSLIEQMVKLGNSELEGRAVFGGFQTRGTPFTQASNGIIYAGDNGNIEFELESSLRMTININGADTFLKPLSTLGEDADLNVAVTAGTLLADLQAGNGIDLATGTFTITDHNNGITSIIDISGATTVNDAITTINTQLVADGIANLTVGIGAEGNNLAFTAVPDGQVSLNSRIGLLNDSNGIDMQPGEIRLTDGGGTNVLIDLSSAVTLNDLITSFNTQVTAAGISNVSMSLNAAGTGLQIDDTNAVPLNLTVSTPEASDSTAADLGIEGTISPVLIGDDLNPAVDFEVQETTGSTAADLGILMDIHRDISGKDIDPLLTSGSFLTDLRNGSGIDLDEIVIWQGERQLSVNLSNPTLVTVQDVLDEINNSGLDVTASLNSLSTGIQIVNDDTNRSLTIEEAGNGRSAKELGIYGSSDMMGSLIVLTNALENDDQEGTSLLLQNMDDAMNNLLTSRSSIGARAIRLESIDARLVDLNLSFTELSSDTEDADLAELITELSTQENNYQAALMAAGKIIQPSLLDFLS
jgi:flagellar hook-associated protein 3 FlgL